jgi:hypothetical protein
MEKIFSRLLSEVLGKSFESDPRISSLQDLS